MIRVFPMVIEAGLGGVDGALQVADLRAGRITNTRQFSTWFEAAALLGGIALDLMRFSPDITEPLELGGLFGLSRRAGVALMQGMTPPAPHAMEYAAARGARRVQQYQDTGMPTMVGGGGGGDSGAVAAFGFDPMNRTYPTGILG
jgi:hypothetical protein